MLLLFVLCSGAMAYAAGSWSAATYDQVTQGSGYKTISWTFTGDAANGTVPNLTITGDPLAYMKGWWIYYVETDPGATAPTALYDVVINNAAGRDIMGGALANRSATATEDAEPTRATPVDGDLTIAVSNNAVNSATATIKIWLAR